MRLLLDSHTLIWAADDPDKLSARARELLLDPANVRFISAGTLWEISIKVGLSRLPLSMPLRPWMERAIADLDLEVLPITLEHADRQAVLPWHHRDPFDRLLAAQSLAEDIPILGIDEVFDRYGVTRLWR